MYRIYIYSRWREAMSFLAGLAERSVKPDQVLSVLCLLLFVLLS